MKQWIDLGGAALRYELQGAGATLVLVHEMGGTLDSWDHVMPALLPGRRILRYDTRGAGQSEKLRGAVRFDDMVADLAGLLDALEIDGPVALAGCAVGAAIALHFAACHPARAAGVVAMGPATGVAAERRGQILALAENVRKLGMRGIVEASFAGSYPPEVRHDPGHYAQFRARWLAGDPDSYAEIYSMLAHADIVGGFSRIACPVLLLAGRLDRLRPPEVVEPLMAQIAGARFMAVESGHFMAVQTPGVVAEVILKFLKEEVLF